MLKTTCLLAALTVPAVTSQAQTPTYTVETRWIAVDTSPAAGAVGTQIPTGTIMDPEATFTVNPSTDFRQRFDLQVRIIDPVGQLNNFGLFGLFGTVSTTATGMTDTVIANRNTTSFTGLGNIAPFNYGPPSEKYMTNGAVSSTDRADSVTNISALRHVVYDTWAHGQPFPSKPAPLGNDWVSVFGLLVDIRADDVAPNSVGEVSVGYVHNDPHFYALGVQDWIALNETGSSSTIPTPTPGNPTEFIWVADPMDGVPMTAEGFTLRVIPAPSAAAMLGLAGLYSTRRRRAC